MHPLLHQVRDVAHQARRLVLREAFARWMCVVLLSLIAVGLADYWFRFREAPLRWLCLIAIGSLAIWRWTKSVLPALADRCSDRQVAQWIERSYPDLREGLSSAVSFLQYPLKDPRYGSESLRADVVRSATAAIADRDLMTILDTRSARRALRALLAVAGLAGVLCAFDSDSAGLALRRLAMPWTNEAWPRMNHLSFTKQPDVLAYGQDFEVELEDKQGRLPEDVRLWFWFDGDDESAARPQRMTFAGGKMTHRLSSITKPFRYRAVGGDDRDMSWIALRVVEPPKIVESRITVQPPAYTGRPAETAERRIRALAGSTVAIQLRVDRPVAAASLSFLSQHVQQKIPAQVATDGRNLKLSEVDGHSWTLTTSGSYGWELTDRDGVTVTIGDNTEVDVIPDLPPVVSLESPATDAAFTARAIVPIRGSVKDDLAIHRIEFHSGETTEVLAEFVAPRATDSTQKPDEHSQHLVEYAWDLAKLAELKPGTSLPFEIVAADFRPQTSLPASGTIRILSDQEFQQRLDDVQSALLKQLNEALRLQRTLHRQTGSLVTQLQSTKVLSAADSAVWPALEPGQRRVTAVLAGEGGARPRVDQLLRELSANRWDAPELAAHLATIQRELGRITEKLLPPVQQRLSQADRSLRFESPEIPAVIQDWIAAAEGQVQVVTALESLVDQLGQWDRYRNLSQEVRQVLEELATVAQETRDLPTAGRDLSQLSAEDRARLEGLAQRLSDLAAQIDRMQTRLDQLQQRLSQSNPSAAKSLREALHVLERDPVSGGLRESSQAVANNRLGAATRGLEQSRGGLEKLLAALEQQPGRDVNQLEQLLSRAIAAFAARQEAVIKETSAWGKRNESPSTTAAAARDLAKAQSDLAADVGDLVRRSPESSGYVLALELAAHPMARAAERLANRQFDEPTLKVEREALNFLKDLMASLANNPTSPPGTPDSNPSQQSAGNSPEHRQPSLAELKLIRLVQLEIMRRTSDLDGRRQEGPLSPEHETELKALAARQRQLAELLENIDSPSAEETPDKKAPADPPTGDPSTEKQKDARRDKRLPQWQFVSLLQRESPDGGQEPPAAPRGRLDRDLLDDSPTKREPGKPPTPAGEDVGQVSRDASPFIELGRQMRQIESRLLGRDTTGPTQLLQRRVAAQLTTLIEQMQQQQPNQPNSEPSAQPRDGDPSSVPQPSPTSQPSAKAGGGSGGTTTDKEGVSNWATRVWGSLPDRVRQQIQDLGDEQFLPEYDGLIRQYYDRLSERGRKQTPAEPRGP